ncbi:MAG: FeoB-associated Cys-rich membrane protein [Prevotella sp.]|nr:FeoB-associated Cys-rich membrane protein [Prevotella sp.]
MQTAIITVVLVLSVAYAAYRLHQAIKGANDPCYGCKGCALRQQMRQKQLENGEKHPCFEKKH